MRKQRECGTKQLYSGSNPLVALNFPSYYMRKIYPGRFSFLNIGEGQKDMPHKRKDLNIKGANLWYFVGLIVTDGCLSPDGRHIDVTSKEHPFLQKIKDTLCLNNRIGIKYNGRGQKSFHIQIANRNFYDFLLSIGIT